MATKADFPDHHNIRSVTDERTRPGPGLPLIAHSGDLLIIDDPGEVPPYPDKMGMVDRARFERLRQAAIEGIENGIGPAYAAHFEPGDLDPLP